MVARVLGVSRAQPSDILKTHLHRNVRHLKRRKFSFNGKSDAHEVRIQTKKLIKALETHARGCENVKESREMMNDETTADILD